MDLPDEILMKICYFASLSEAKHKVQPRIFTTTDEPTTPTPKGTPLMAASKHLRRLTLLSYATAIQDAYIAGVIWQRRVAERMMDLWIKGGKYPTISPDLKVLASNPPSFSGSMFPENTPAFVRPWCPSCLSVIAFDDGKYAWHAYPMPGSFMIFKTSQTGFAFTELSRRGNRTICLYYHFPESASDKFIPKWDRIIAGLQHSADKYN